MADVGTGRVAIVIEGYSGLAGALTGGQSRASRCRRYERLADFKDLPTVAEVLPGFIAGGWNVLLAPIGTPDAIIRKASADLRKALDDAELKTKLAALGAFLHPMTPERGHRLRPGAAAHLAAGGREGRRRGDGAEVNGRSSAVAKRFGRTLACCAPDRGAGRGQRRRKPFPTGRSRSSRRSRRARRTTWWRA